MQQAGVAAPAVAAAILARSRNNIHSNNKPTAAVMPRLQQPGAAALADASASAGTSLASSNNNKHCNNNSATP